MSCMPVLMGMHAIDELLRHAPEKIVRIYFAEGKRDEKILLLCEKRKIPVQWVSKRKLEELAGSPSHQSIVAEIRERQFLSPQELLQRTEKEASSLVLMVDRLFDPQNFGAILRSAECFGVSGVVWSKNRGVDLTPTVVKASCGASELVPLVRVSNLAYALEEFQEAGFFAVAALAQPSAENALTFSFPQKTLLIVGSEGEGIQPLLQKKVDHSIFIPMQGKIASLNVSNATAILLALWRSR
ncbi:MAG: 23S rRNA (guanosine(2251)-2'-O)-methyltransferase RlmB [Verrucomicrobiota bacterium]|nr:23S rRNA (guanosine(2251)-2'-O)-methyltransferase RlmB [Verrucomicrobiota bacterium]